MYSIKSEMKTKSLIVLIVVAAVLGFLSWKVIMNSRPNSTIDTYDRQFAIPKIETVEKIFIADRNSIPITLEKKNGIWYLNEKYKAFPNAVQNLLYVMQKMSIQSIPPKVAHPNIMKGMASVGIKIEAYGKNNQVLKTYYVGGATNDERGVYFLMDKASQPYIMELKNFNSNIRHRFALGFNDWRDRSILDLEGENIQFVEFNYTFSPDSSFTIVKEGSSYHFHTSGIHMQIAESPFLQSFFYSLQKVETESILTDTILRDSLLGLPPYVSIKIKSEHKDTLTVRLFPLNERKDNTLDFSKEFLSSRAFFRIWAVRNDGEFYLLQWSQISKTMKFSTDFKKAILH
jgi:hypothetical protein